MSKSKSRVATFALGAGLTGAVAIGLSPATALADCLDLPGHGTVKAVLSAIAGSGNNAGLDFEMWATLVDRDGVVCVVAFSGIDRGDQWPGSRVISAQKASTANAFSLPGLALSTANLWAATQPGGSLFGLQFSNPVDTAVAYGNFPNDHDDSDASDYGTAFDPMVGSIVGGVNVFGGGLAAYRPSGELVGAIGVSGDTSCTDHIIAWKLRDALNLDTVPAGVSSTGDDNMIQDLVGGVSASGFGHPDCGFGESGIIATLPIGAPIE
jgi:uncharacterized protein GlcG (DUF336 family)